jgi:hypothetical protein
MVSWFISWEAARFSMEAQRLIALQFFGFAFPKAQPNKQSCEERSSGEENATVPRQAPTIAFAEDVVTPSKGIRPAQKRTVAARSNRQIRNVGKLRTQMPSFWLRAAAAMTQLGCPPVTLKIIIIRPVPNAE